MIINSYLTVFLAFSLQLVHFVQIEYGDLEDRYDNILLGIPHSVRSLPRQCTVTMHLRNKQIKTLLFALGVKTLSTVYSFWVFLQSVTLWVLTDHGQHSKNMMQTAFCLQTLSEDTETVNTLMIFLCTFF